MNKIINNIKKTNLKTHFKIKIPILIKKYINKSQS